jgi:pimeloyl-ACP methyl ester carboxylesterase
MKDHPGSFDVSVLGRSRGGRYRALSEADVLHVLDYIATHWVVDLDRVHLNGGSMGGGGTFWLGSRYPQRFASGRTVCGYASDKPLGNLLTFPIYATHSDDDWTVPVLHSRGPIAKLRALGGNATLDETTGYGHAAWNYAAGNARADAWYVKQVRPPSHEVKRLDFTALDGSARRAFWAEVTEWGRAPTPAHFTLEATAPNHLEARLQNIARLTLRLSEAPIDPKLPLRVSIAGAPALRLPAPLPSSIVLAQGQGSWAFEDLPSAHSRRREPALQW